MTGERRTEDEAHFSKRLGQTIRMYRLIQGMDQPGLAKAAGFSQPGTISRWENGATSISAYDLTRIAKALGREPGELLSPPPHITVKMPQGAAG